jgi:UPF0755 protein
MLTDHKKVLKICGLALAAFVVLALAGALIFRSLNKAPSSGVQAISGISFNAETNEVIMEIRGGESADETGGRLKEAGLIRSRYLWSAICRIDNSFLKAGLYKFGNNLSATDIHKLFVDGTQMLFAVTIPEGWTIKKITRLFRETGICDPVDFSNAVRDKDILAAYDIPDESAEGYLYPDTYYFTLGYPAGKVVKTMLDNFYRKLVALNIDKSSFSEEEFHNKVILASIIEREYRAQDEAALMAGVFQNRIDRGMKLESCATVEYIITEIEGKAHPTRLFFRDLEIINPYNTYLYKGLPPSPISSPGEIALKAAFFPDKNDYLFFRLRDPAEGRHHFSKTYDEHLRMGPTTFYVKGY